MSARDPGRGRRAVPLGDQVQRQVDAAGDAGGGDHAAVGDVDHVALDPGPRIALGELVLQIVVRGAAPVVQQPGPAQHVGAGADAGHGAAGGVVRDQPAQQLRAAGAGRP